MKVRGSIQPIVVLGPTEKRIHRHESHPIDPGCQTRGVRQLRELRHTHQKMRCRARLRWDHRHNPQPSRHVPTQRVLLKLSGSALSSMIELFIMANGKTEMQISTKRSRLYPTPALSE